MILILWLITSPLWMACYILPTTQKGFTFGRDAGVTAMVAGLAVSVIIAVSQLIALLAETGHGLVPIAAPAAIVIGEGMIGTAFRFAGGIIGTASGAVSGFHSGALNGLKNYRKEQRKSNMGKVAGGDRFKGMASGRSSIISCSIRSRSSRLSVQRQSPSGGT